MAKLHTESENIARVYGYPKKEGNEYVVELSHPAEIRAAEEACMDNALRKFNSWVER